MKSYGDRLVVNKVSIRVQKGEVIGLLGPNGAGKTTIFYMLFGLIKPQGGAVFLNGKDITALPPHLRAVQGLGFLPQEPSVFRKLTVASNILAVLELTGLSKKEMRAKAWDLMEKLELLHIKDTKACFVSGGERRRVEIARALALSPDFILLDEPFSGIDPMAVAEIKKTISFLQEKDIGLLLTDHNVRDTLEIVKRAYIINKGEIISSGSPREVARCERAKRYYFGDGFDY